MTTQHKVAIIAFICSLAFAATTVFLLCLLQPKSSRLATDRRGGKEGVGGTKGSLAASSGQTTKYGLDAYEALAGLPIKKRSFVKENQDEIEIRMVVEPLYDEWIEMGLSIRTIRMYEEEENDQKSSSRRKRMIPKISMDFDKQFNSSTTSLTTITKTIINPMERVFLWQDEFQDCQEYDSIKCQKFIQYWMMMNGLEKANIVKHGKRNELHFRDEEEEEILRKSQVGLEVNEKDGKVEIEKAKEEARKQGLMEGFLVDTEYPTTIEH